MERHRKVRRSTVASALGTALAVSVLLPAGAVGDPVGDVLGGLGVGGNSGGGGTASNDVTNNTGSAQDRAGTPPNYKPPLHGTNPHGEGTVATVDLMPSNSNPYPGSPSAGDEEVVLGDSRGEQNGGSYHGRVTLAYVALPVPGFPVVNVFIESNPGEYRQGPTAPLNSGPLSTLCTTSGGNVCIQVLPMDSSTSSTESSNLFAILRGSFLQGQTTVNLGTSSGSIQEAGGCQTATGTSSIANGNVAGLGAFDVFSASSSSTACNGAHSTQNSSTFLNLFGVTPTGAGLPIVGPFLTGCANLVPNSSFVGPGGLLGLVCHGDDVNGGQTAPPYGVREAFAAFVGIVGNTALIKLGLSGPESHAVAPPASPGAPGGQGGVAGKAKKGAPGEAGAVAGEAAAGSGGGELAFTGENLLLLGLIGTGLVGLGLLGAAAGRRRTV